MIKLILHLLLMGIAVFGVFGLIVWGSMALEVSYYCSNYEKATGKATKRVGLECFVEVSPGEWRARGEMRQGDVK